METQMSVTDEDLGKLAYQLMELGWKRKYIEVRFWISEKWRTEQNM